MSTSDNDLIDLLKQIPIILHRSLAIILFIIGNLGNVVSILVFLKKTWRKNVCAFYFIICLICDLIFVNSSILGSIFVSGFQVNIQNSSDVLCKFFFYVSYVFASYLAIVLILASIDRLLISSQNVEMRLYSSRRLAYFSLLTSFIVWSIFSLHLLVKAGIQEIYPTVFACYYDLSTFYLDFFSYTVIVLSTVIPSILIVLSILAFKNVRRIRAVPRQQRKQVRSMNKRDFQLLRCLYIYNIAYILCSVLLGASVIYGRTLRYQIPTSFDQALDSFLSGIGSVLHYIPYCCSIFIFISTSKAFRQELIRGVYKLIGKDASGVREEENQHIDGIINDNDNRMNVAAISTVALQD